MTMLRNASLSVLAVAGFVSLASAGCRSLEPDANPKAGGHTNWLTCIVLSDCASASTAVRCSDGYCLDTAGQRIAVVAVPASTEGSPRANADASGGSGAVVDAGAADEGAVGSSTTHGDAAAVVDSGADSAGPGEGGASGECSGLPVGCGVQGAACCDPYPCDGKNFCRDGLQCCVGGCQPDCNPIPAAVRIPECPGPMERCDSTRCRAGEPCVQCPDGQVCLEVELSCGAAAGASAQCVADPCTGGPLDCSCARAVCDTLPPEANGWTCGVYSQGHFLVGPDRAPFMSCGGGGICASPDTPIATPRGKVAIAELRPGDLVYSLHDRQLVVVPLLAVARTPVSAHTVLRVSLEDATVLEVSGPHPTADGRRLDQLAVGQVLDGRSIVAIERIPYRHAFTYDLLPASETGAYLAGGVWLGSTLQR